MQQETKQHDKSIMFPLSEVSKTPIIIRVNNPTQIKSTLSSYTVYTLNGEDQKGVFEITRRYSEFDIIRQFLLKNWPGCYVPPIPQKKIMNKTDQDFVEHRRYNLELFCNEIKLLHHLWFSEQFQMFLRNKSGDLQTGLKALGGQNCEEIIKKYDQKLIYLKGRTLDTLIINKVLQFNKFLRKIQPIISSFKQMLASFLEAKNNNYEQYSILYNYILPEYEKCCLANYLHQDCEGKVIFTDDKDEKISAFISKIRDIINRRNFNRLLLMIEREQRQINAFLQVYNIHALHEKKIGELRQKQKELEIQQQNLNLGKQGIIKSLFRSNIEDSKKDVERSITVNKEFISTQVLLSDLITLLLGYFEIDRFKTTKLQNYEMILKEIAIVQVELCRAQTIFAGHLLENQNLP